jgi:hypothetical protein
MRYLLTFISILSPLAGTAQASEKTLEEWIKNSSAIFTAKVWLKDEAGPDYYQKNSAAHIYVETSSVYYFPDETLDLGPEFYLHYQATPNGFHPRNKQTYIFFVRQNIGGPEPVYWTLAGDSIGAIPFSLSIEKELCRLLYSQKGDSLSCNALPLHMQRLNDQQSRMGLIDLMLHATPPVWDAAVKNFLCVLQSDSFNSTAKLSALYLLGTNQAKEAIPLLISRVGQELFPENKKTLDERECQAYEALKMIGDPAYEPLEKHLNECMNYQEFKMTILTLNSIRPFRTPKATRRFAETHYKSAPERLKPFYRFMMLDIGQWEKEVNEFNERMNRY